MQSDIQRTHGLAFTPRRNHHMHVRLGEPGRDRGGGKDFASRLQGYGGELDGGVGGNLMMIGRKNGTRHGNFITVY